AFDPRQIDLYALGELLCRLLTGESAEAFSRSARVKGRVPVPLWPVLERSLAINGQASFQDAGELRRALHSSVGQMAPDESAAAQVSADNSSGAAAGLQDDTKPSFVSTGEKPADTSIGPVAATPRGSGDTIPFARLGHYEITGRIGHGGMGDVYLG